MLINVVLGVIMNISMWLCGYAVTYWLFSTVKDVYENVCNESIRDNYLQLCWVIGVILLVVYTYLVYKLGWYQKIF